MNNNTALMKITDAKNKGALVFANIENFQSQVELYRTEVTQLAFRPEDFHNIQGKFMPSKSATDRIGEASGIQFIQSACKVFTEIREDDICGKRTVYRAEAQGKLRMPDGSWRESTVDEYEFDPVLRAMLDNKVTELNEQTRRNVARNILEYTKVARQRAATGARLRVIRQLTGMPSAFTLNETKCPMIFTRVVQNTSYILNTPEGRAMATAQALGVDVASLFGAKKSLPPAEPAAAIRDASGTSGSGYVDVAPAMPPSDNNDDDTPPQGETIPDFDAPPNQAISEFERLADVIREYLEGYGEELNIYLENGANPYKSAEAELQNPNATLETRKDMIARLRKFLILKGCKI